MDVYEYVHLFSLAIMNNLVMMYSFIYKFTRLPITAIRTLTYLYIHIYIME